MEIKMAFEDMTFDRQFEYFWWAN